MKACRRGLSGIDLAIIHAVQAETCEGLHCLALQIGANPCRLRSRLEHLQCAGLVVIKYPRVSGPLGRYIIEKGRAQLCDRTIPGIC